MRRLLAFGLAALLAGEAAAQQPRRPAAAPPPPKEEPAPEPPPAAYEPELLRLAEVLGTLSYMTALCGPAGGPQPARPDAWPDAWRARMGELIDAEGVTAQRRERLAGAFNRGFLGHQPAHRACTDRARQIIDRMIEQGQRLTRDIASRYAG